MKYKLTKNTKLHLGIKLFQIEATVSFGDIAKGDLGGWIEKEWNLDQFGNAWVTGNARVYGNARVTGDARVYGNALVSGDAMVYGNAWVSGDARVYGNAWVSGKLALTLGSFFGMKYGDENIQYIKQDDNEIICKGSVKVEEIKDEPKEIEKVESTELIEMRKIRSELMAEANRIGGKIRKVENEH